MEGRREKEEEGSVIDMSFCLPSSSLPSSLPQVGRVYNDRLRGGERGEGRVQHSLCSGSGRHRRHRLCGKPAQSNQEREKGQSANSRADHVADNGQWLINHGMPTLPHQTVADSSPEERPNLSSTGDTEPEDKKNKKKKKKKKKDPVESHELVGEWWLPWQSLWVVI